MKRTPFREVLQPGAVVVVERVDSTALVIGTVIRCEKTTALLQPLGTKRRQRVALDRVRRAGPLGDVSPEVVGTITRHHAAGIAVHAQDIGIDWGHKA